MIDKYTFDRNEIIKNTVKDFFSTKPCVEFVGHYTSWKDALYSADGYDSEMIFNKSKSAAIEVKNGNACYERDSCLFYDNEKYYELLYLIERVINETGKAQILDFGGGLGSMYFQHRDQLIGRDNITWTVVEQEHFVDFGQNNLENTQISFKKRIEDVKSFNLVILGSVLQYLDNYRDYLELILEKKPDYIFIDRTPMSSDEWITIENVHEPIYEASYPMHVFEINSFIKIFTDSNYKYEGGWHPQTGNIFRWKNRKVIFESMVLKR